MTGAPQFGPSAITPDGYAVNTMAPPYWPTWIRDPERPDYSKPALPQPASTAAQTHTSAPDSRQPGIARLGAIYGLYGLGYIIPATFLYMLSVLTKTVSR